MMNSVLIQEGYTTTFGQKSKPQINKDHEVLIKVHSAPINPSDVYLTRGMWGIELKHPYTPGWEGAGEVIDAGKEAKSFIGKRVAFIISMEHGGSWGEYVVTSI